MMNQTNIHAQPEDIPAAVVAEMEFQKSEALAKTNKKLVTIVMGLTLMLGMVACMAYLAGRTVTAMKVQSVEAKGPSPAQPPSIIVDSPKMSSELAQAPAAVIEAPMPIAAAVVANAAPVAVNTVSPAKGELYLQVGYVDHSQASSLMATINGRGFQAKAISGNDESTKRVVVGPIQQGEMASYQARLMDAGFESFPRRF